MEHKKLYVVSVISNPVRYKSRYALYHRFAKQIEQAGAILHTVEAAFGDRKFEVTDPCNPRHTQLRSWDELWLKENLINIGISRLPADAEYIAWIDADIAFVRPDWVHETIQQLQHHMVVQMFQDAIDLGPNDEFLMHHQGFCYSHVERKPFWKKDYGKFWHPGYAWAARREALDHLGGLIDTAILGAADHHMALALIGKADVSIHSKSHSNYRAEIVRWEHRATEHIKQDIGYVKGMVLHYWHGPKAKRYYVERWDILHRNGFDPFTDIKRDAQGLWQLCGNKPKLRDDLRWYNRARDEDSNCY